MKPAGSRFIILIVTLLIILPCGHAARLFAQSSRPAAQISAFPTLEADPLARELALRAWNGTYTWQDLTDIALWASGAQEYPPVPRNQKNPGPVRSYKEIIAAAAEELRNSPDLPVDLRDRGEYVLTFLYGKFMKAYSLNQTRLDEIFTTGRYNCVSSAVLYTILATAAGLDVRGVMTRDHAFATVNTGPESIDVETTNRYGFDPGSRREFHDNFGTVTGFAYVPARNYRDRVSISPLELVSLIMSNRIAELEARNRYSEAVPLAVNRAALLANRRDPVASPFFADGEKELLDRLLNYGTTLLKAGKETDALAWVEAASARYPGGTGTIAGPAVDPRWLEFAYAALNNYTLKLIRAGRFTEAREALARYTSRVSAANSRALDAMILDAELIQRVNALGKTEDAETLLLVIDEVRRNGILPANRTEELRNFVILKEGERLAAQEGSLAAMAYTEAAITRYGRNTQLDQGLRVHRQNRLADLHNRFALLFNSRDYEAAREHILGALTEFPDNNKLQSDLSTVDQALRQP
jgi:tetratricopeptide (TPR) repeat protein